jgi:hypothetical protein
VFFAGCPPPTHPGRVFLWVALTSWGPPALASFFFVGRPLPGRGKKCNPAVPPTCHRSRTACNRPSKRYSCPSLPSCDYMPSPKASTYLPTFCFEFFVLRFSCFIFTTFAKLRASSALLNHFYGVFELLTQRNGQKNAIKNSKEKRTGKGTWICSNFFNPVFELPLLRNAQKKQKTKTKQNKQEVPTYLI